MPDEQSCCIYLVQLPVMYEIIPREANHLVAEACQPGAAPSIAGGIFLSDRPSYKEASHSRPRTLRSAKT